MTDPRPDRARRELIAIQKRLWRRLQREIEATIEGDPPNIAIYKEEYERDLRRYEAISSKRELVEAAAGADVVYLGDYHTLPQAQKTLVKLLLALTKLPRPVVLGLEMVHTKDQPHLERYLRDPSKAEEERFLKAIDYRRTWDFAWGPYREVLHVAHRRGVRVVGINSDPADHPDDHLLERDFQSAEVLVRELMAQPEALLVVFDGDLHVARDHLPLLVDNLARKAKLPPRRRVIVHQNAEEIWWQLARARQEHQNVVRLAPDAFCVLNASPIEKLHSYLNWVSERETLEPPLATSAWELSDEDDEDEDYEDDDDLEGERVAEYQDQVLQIVSTVAGFLQIERDDLDSFRLFTVNDLDFLEALAEEGAFTERELEDVKRQILSNESYYIPRGDVIYLSDFSVVNAAEEATHFLHHLCSRYRWDKPRDLATDFYFRVLTEALGFFGSKLLVPTRECWRERDCEVYVERHRARSRERRRKREARGEADPGDTAVLQAIPEERVKLLLSQALTLRASRLVLRHKKLERRYLETGEWSGAGKCLTQPTEGHLLLTHMLGHMLGDRLYAALVLDVIDKARLRQLFHDPIERPGLALARYLELIEVTRDVPHPPGRGDLL
ncbi:MAG: ChaN family lipoprotein [Planctomycetota bacterium]